MILHVSCGGGVDSSPWIRLEALVSASVVHIVTFEDLTHWQSRWGLVYEAYMRATYFQNSIHWYIFK